ncbi:MAG: phenylalanine dehydrogenase, partial [Deltaproteobacteria bacterium]
MESLIRQWQGETVITRYDSPTGAWIFIAVYSTLLGPAAGGTRMRPYPNPQAGLEDAMRLAKGMAYKYAVPGMPWGGGKAVIALPD